VAVAALIDVGAAVVREVEARPLGAALARMRGWLPSMQ